MCSSPILDRHCTRLCHSCLEQPIAAISTTPLTSIESDLPRRGCVYPGIVEALKELQRLGVRLFVATSKPQPFTEQILDHFRLRSLFHGVYGSALDGRLSNKGELISHIMKEGLAPLETAMVGDRAQDIDGARANDVFAIGVLWGYGSREELLSAGAEALCEQPRGLAETVSFNYPFNPARAEKPARAG